MLTEPLAPPPAGPPPASPVLADAGLLRADAFIDGAWSPSLGGHRYPVADPATGHVLCHVARCGEAEADRAILAAQAALPGWRATPETARSRLLRGLHYQIITHAGDLALLVTLESGKPLAEAREEVLYAAGYVEWFAECAKRINGEVIPAPRGDMRLLAFREAVGVVGCITPWNFPLAMLARKVAPALAAGCTVVCKPSEETPLAGLALAELVRRAGFPAGCVNLVSGDAPAIGRALTRSPLVRKLTFTGSTATGKALLAACAATMKRTSMELGGNAPFLVFADADLGAAVDGLLAAKFRNAGQTCIAPNRVLAEAPVQDAVAARLLDAVGRMRVGNGLDPGVGMGPLVHAGAVDRVLALVGEAVSRGARLLCGGARTGQGDAFLAPTLLTGVTPDMAIARQEIFGPVLAVGTFEDEDEALRVANDTASGLAAYAYTRDAGRLWRLPRRLEVGMCGLNSTSLSNPMAPFGGIKESGHGREGSTHGLDDYLDWRVTCLGGL